LNRQKGKIYASFYTDSLSPDKAAIVRRIAAPGGCDEFRTDRLTFDGDEEPAQTIIQLRAQKFPGTESWEIIRCTEYDAGGGKTLDIAHVLSNLCFFDALYYCAKFQTTEQSLGQVVLDRDGDVPHYREVGEAAGQPFDGDLGTPVPAVNGRIIGSGRFDGDPDSVAARSKNMELLPEYRTTGQTDWLPSVLSLRMKVNEIDPADENNSLIDNRLRRLRDKHALSAAFNNVTEKGDRLLRSFTTASRNGFASHKVYSFGHIFFGIISAGILTFMIVRQNGVAYVLEDIHPVKNFHIALKEFSKAVAKLPDVPEKKACEEFAKVAAYSLHMERAAYLDGKIRNGKFSKRMESKMVSAINKAAAGLHPGDDTAAQVSAARLKRAFAEGKIKREDNRNIVNIIWRTRNINSNDYGKDAPDAEADAFLKSHGLIKDLEKSLNIRKQQIENSPV
jgi:hypothetical protein